VALQEGGHYLNMERLKAMVETFREAISSLTPEQKAVLVDRIKHLGMWSGCMQLEHACGQLHQAILA
jgi:hypothetical protein